jgi:hypothetical protein
VLIPVAVTEETLMVLEIVTAFEIACRGVGTDKHVSICRDAMPSTQLVQPIFDTLRVVSFVIVKQDLY